MGVRSSNTTLKDEDDDYAHQIVIGDLERLSMDASVIATDLEQSIADNIAALAALEAQIAAVSGDALIGGYSTKTLYTSGSGTHTFTAGKTRFIAVLVGGGGGGSLGIGATFGTSGTYLGAGGGGGGAVVALGVIASASASYVVGAGGVVDTGSGAGAGEVSTITHDGTTLTANAGLPGSVSGGGGEGGRPVVAGGSSAVLDALIQGNSTLGFPIAGQAGQGGSVASITFSAGLTSSFAGIAARGGRSIFNSGNTGVGGSGERAGSNSASAGNAGLVVFYEK